MWPQDPDALVAEQRRLATETPEQWRPRGDWTVGGCWVCFPRGLTGPGERGDVAWAAAVVVAGNRVLAEGVVEGEAGWSYVPGLLAMRTGPLLERAVTALPRLPDVLLVDGTGRDHPRRAGLALQLGAELGLPTVGVTHRPLAAAGEWPDDSRGATSPLRIGDEPVAAWVRTRPGTRPLVVHPGWGVDLETAVEVVTATARRRTPEPLRRARHVAREARNQATGVG